MRRAVQFLLRFCAEGRLEKKYLVVPSYQVGHQVGEALAKEGGSWVNLHFVTLPALAQKVAGAELSKGKTRFISSTGSFFLVDKIFRKLKDGGARQRLSGNSRRYTESSIGVMFWRNLGVGKKI